ncbi:MAG TPA: hypothetical protein VM120_11095 [Bryobacteraceae bacterium]|nr:hypothetical protein [Bryobacteraceae bacterium]
MLPRMLSLLFCCSLLTQAANIFVMSSGRSTSDAELRRALESFGHSVTLGVPFDRFDGTQNLAGVDVVYLQVNYNWIGSGFLVAIMPFAGQAALVNFVNRGGGLVTTEWLLWLTADWGHFFSGLDSILPVYPSLDWDTQSTAVTFTRNVADEDLNAGLPASFGVPLDNIDGTRTLISLGATRAGASAFYTMDGGFIALAGWNAGGGRVLSFATLNGEAQLRDAGFRRLLGNAINWAVRPSVSAGGVVNAASFARGQPVVPGSLVSIFGSGLASSLAAAESIPLPNSLGGVGVTFNGIAAPVQFVSPRQINAQLPWEVLSGGATSGTASAVIRRGSAISEAIPVQVSPASPGIFSVEFGSGQAIAFQEDGSLAASAGALPGIRTEPARIGGTISILATGLGAVDPPGRDSQSSLDTQRRTLTTPTVLIGGVEAQVRFSGLAPEFPGVYQINVVIPAATPGDRVPIQIRLGDFTSTDRITIALRN